MSCIVGWIDVRRFENDGLGLKSEVRVGWFLEFRARLRDYMPFWPRLASLVPHLQSACCRETRTSGITEYAAFISFCSPAVTRGAGSSGAKDKRKARRAGHRSPISTCAWC